MQPASPSPLYASPLSSVGYSTELPAGYRVTSGRDGYQITSDDFGLIEGPCGFDFDTYEGACFAAQDHADGIASKSAEADRIAAEEAYEEALDRFHALVKAEAAAPYANDDPEARGRARAARVLVAAIDGLSTQTVAA